MQASFAIFGLHLSALYSAWTEQRRVFELRALLASIRRHQHGFHVLTGDFNTLAPGDLLDFRKLPHRLRALVWLSGGRIRWRTIQLILDAGYVDAYRMLHGTDPGYTFPTWAPHVRLDYLFFPAAYAGRVQACEIITGSRGPRRVGSSSVPDADYGVNCHQSPVASHQLPVTSRHCSTGNYRKRIPLWHVARSS